MNKMNKIDKYKEVIIREENIVNGLIVKQDFDPDTVFRVLIDECAELTQLPPMPKLVILSVSGPNKLTEIPYFPKLKTLKLYPCSALVKIAPMPLVLIYTLFCQAATVDDYNKLIESGFTNPMNKTVSTPEPTLLKKTVSTQEPKPYVRPQIDRNVESWFF